MRKLIYSFLLLLSLIFGNSLYANSLKIYTVESVPNVYVKDARLHVSDPEKLLSSVACDSINRMFTSLEKKTGIQAIVVMLPSIGDEDIFEFSQKLFRHWGIGEKKRNNGLLVVYVSDQRTIRFHTGYGIEGSLPDAKCKRIQSQYMIPAFRQGDINKGMVDGMKAVSMLLDGSMDAKTGDDEESNPYVSFLLFGGIVAVAIWFIWHGDKMSRTCKSCKKAGALKKTSTDYYKDKKGRKHRKDIYKCSNCGHIEVRDNIIDDNNHGDALTKGVITGSILGGMHGRSGGGFSGGSFGGGSTGGGGSSSSW